jgi:hypothetical protein
VQRLTIIAIIDSICHLDRYREGDLSLNALRVINAIFAYIELYLYIKPKMARSRFPDSSNNVQFTTSIPHTKLLFAVLSSAGLGASAAHTSHWQLLGIHLCGM